MSEELRKLRDIALANCVSAYQEAQTEEYGRARAHNNLNNTVNNAGHHASVYLALSKAIEGLSLYDQMQERERIAAWLRQKRDEARAVSGEPLDIDFAATAIASGVIEEKGSD